jgi:hypothetical protein
MMVGGGWDGWEFGSRCDVDDLLDLLRAGVPIAGETPNGSELYDIDAAETTMALAADTLERMKPA